MSSASGVFGSASGVPNALVTVMIVETVGEAGMVVLGGRIGCGV